MNIEVETHAVQMPFRHAEKPVCPKAVTMAAYEVYCHVYAPQEEMITGNCPRGFSAGEIIAFLYARSFPKGQWRIRVNEALNGMKL